MLVLDGIQYQVKSPDENLDDIVTYVNNYCESHQIKNTKGETIYIDDNEANPLYQMFRGYAYMLSVIQKLVYSAGCSYSIAESSEEQLLNLSDIAGVKRTTPTRTVIPGVAYAAAENGCSITTEATATVVVSGEEIEFHPAYAVQIPAGGSAYIVLVANRVGPINLSENTITAFDEPIENLRLLTTGISTPGQDLETIASLRNRLQRRQTSNTQIERAADAIQALEGVAMCSIYFNYSSIDNENIPYGNTTVSLPPRQALLVVQGWSTETNAIARTFYRYLMCKTGGGDVDGVLTQEYVTHAGQSLTVNILPPVSVPLYVKVYTRAILSDQQESSIKYTICALSGRLGIGQTVSSAIVLQTLLSTYSNLQIQGVELSVDNETYTYEQTPSPLSLFALSIDNIMIVGANS